MKDEWTESYSLVMPMLGVIIGVVGVSLSLLALTRQTQTVGGLEAPTGVAVDVPKVRYSDSQVFVEVRNPGEWHPITSFVQPNDPWVKQIVAQVL